MSNVPDCTLSRPLPYEERQRVRVPKFGRMGVTMDRLTFGGVTTGFGVILDNGEHVTVAPTQIEVRPARQTVPDILPSNVIRFADARR